VEEDNQRWIVVSEPAPRSVVMVAPGSPVTPCRAATENTRDMAWALIDCHFEPSIERSIRKVAAATAIEVVVPRLGQPLCSLAPLAIFGVGLFCLARKN